MQPLSSGVYDITRQTYGRLDIVIANAGGNLVRQSLEDSDIVAWEGTIRLNLIGVYYTAKFAIPYLKAEGGHIIVVGSGVGHRVADNTHSAYGASKAGAWMLTRALARELSHYSICVNELIPGLVATDLTSNMSRPPDSPLRAEWIKAPDDVVPLALFIASQPLTRPHRAELQFNAAGFAISLCLDDGEHRLQVFRLGKTNGVIQGM